MQDIEHMVLPVHAADCGRDITFGSAFISFANILADVICICPFAGLDVHCILDTVGGGSEFVPLTLGVVSHLFAAGGAGRRRHIHLGVFF